MTTTRATHKRAVIAAFVAVLMGVPGARSAEAEPAEPGGWKTKTVEVNSPYEDHHPVSGDGIKCFGFAASDPQCRFIVTGAARWTGTFVGEAEFELDAWYDPQEGAGHLFYEGWGVQGNRFVDVFIEGCGRGGFHMEEWDGVIDYTQLDPVNDTAPGYNKWRVRPGSGTGDLVGLEGEGENNWVTHTANTPVTDRGNYGEGVFTGTLRCRVRASDASPAAAAATEPVKVAAASTPASSAAPRSSVAASSPAAPATTTVHVEPAAAELVAATTALRETRSAPLSTTGAPTGPWVISAALLVVIGATLRVVRWRLVR